MEGMASGLGLERSLFFLLPHLILTTILWGTGFNPHFICEKSEAQRGKVICRRSLSLVVETSLKFKSLVSKIVAASYCTPLLFIFVTSRKHFLRTPDPSSPLCSFFVLNLFPDPPTQGSTLLPGSPFPWPGFQTSATQIVWSYPKAD